MSRRAPSRPCLRTLVRISQPNRFASQSLCRAFELALPVVTQPLAQPRSAKSSSPKKRRHVA